MGIPHLVNVHPRSAAFSEVAARSYDLTRYTYQSTIIDTWTTTDKTQPGSILLARSAQHYQVREVRWWIWAVVDYNRMLFAGMFAKIYIKRFQQWNIILCPYLDCRLPAHYPLAVGVCGENGCSINRLQHHHPESFVRPENGNCLW